MVAAVIASVVGALVFVIVVLVGLIRKTDAAMRELNGDE